MEKFNQKEKEESQNSKQGGKIIIEESYGKISEKDSNERLKLSKELQEARDLRERRANGELLNAKELALIETAGISLKPKEKKDNSVSEQKQENTPETKTQETPKTSETEAKPEKEKIKISDDVLGRARFLSLSKEDLEKNAIFSSLSGGKQALVLEQLRQMAAENAKSNAAVRQQENYKKSGLFGKFLKNFTKESERIKFEREEFVKMAGGGVGVYGKDLEALSEIAKRGSDVEFEDGKFKIKYLSEVAGIEENKIKDFNEIASRFSDIPEEYSFKTASKKERAEYEKAYDEYEKAKRNMMETMKKKGYDESKIFLRFNKLENEVKLNQFLNTNKDVEKYISGINNKNRFLAALTSGGAEKASYGAAGYIARTAAIGAFGAIGAPLGAALFGGVSSGIRAKRELLNRERTSRKGVEHKGEEDRNFVSAGDLFKKLEDLRMKEFEIDSTRSQMDEIRERLLARLRYTQDKIDAGLVNYGNGGEASVNRYNLISALSRGIAQTGISKFSDKSLGEIKELTRGGGGGLIFEEGKMTAGDTAMFGTYDLMGVPYKVVTKDQKEMRKNLSIEDRMRSFLDFRNEAISGRQKTYIMKKAIRGAAISAGFALGGYMIRHYAGEWFGGDKKGVVEIKKSGAVESAPVGESHEYIENIKIEDYALGTEAMTEEGSEAVGVAISEEKGNAGIINVEEGVEMVLEKEVALGETLSTEKINYVEENLFKNLKAGESIKNRLEKMLALDYNLTDENYAFKDGQHIIKDFQKKGFNLVLKTGEDGEIKFGVNGPAALGRYNWGESGKNWFFKPDAKFDQENLKKAIEFIKKANDSFYKGPSDYSGDPYDISGDGIRK